MPNKVNSKFWKLNTQLGPSFELGSPIPFPISITDGIVLHLKMHI